MDTMNEIIFGNGKECYTPYYDNIEKEWFRELKGDLIPLNCGHILFYDRELETIKTIIRENLENDFDDNNYN